MRGKINLNHIYLLFCLLIALPLGAINGRMTNSHFLASSQSSPKEKKVWIANLRYFPINGYKITLKSNLKNHKVYMYYQYGENQYPLDTTVANSDGIAVFEKNLQIQGGVFLLYLTPDKAIEFLLTDENNFSISTDTADILGKTSFIGSKENSVYYDFLRKIKFNEFQKEIINRKIQSKKYAPDSLAILQNLYSLYQKQDHLFKKQIIEKNKGSFVANLLKANLWRDAPQTMTPKEWAKWGKYHFFDEVNFSDERLAYSPVLFEMYKEYINSHVAHTGDSIIAACDTILRKANAGKENFKWSLYFLSSSFERSAVPGQDKVFVHLVENYYLKYKAWWMSLQQLNTMERRSTILKNLFVGNVCPDFTATDSAGKPVNLHKQITKLTVLYFWSYDCEHCLVETPKLAAWIKNHKEINLITACATPDEDKWKEKLNELKISGTHLIDSDMKANYINLYNINTTPEIFVIDKNKKILAKYLNDTKELEEFLKNVK